MQFDFDKPKSQANKAKHGIDFVEAQALWLSGPRGIPARTVDGENREAFIGKIGAGHWTVIVTRRGETFRIISARRARDSERKLYDEA